MNQEDEYIAGPHHYWIHFGCGLIFGAAIGAWIGSQLTSAFELAATVVLFAWAFGYSCGRWGDRAWHWIIQHVLP